MYLFCIWLFLDVLSKWPKVVSEKRWLTRKTSPLTKVNGSWCTELTNNRVQRHTPLIMTQTHWSISADHCGWTHPLLTSHNWILKVRFPISRISGSPFIPPLIQGYNTKVAEDKIIVRRASGNSLITWLIFSVCVVLLVLMFKSSVCPYYYYLLLGTTLIKN